MTADNSDNVVYVNFACPKLKRAREKREFFAEMASKGVVYVCLDASADGVCVPKQYEDVRFLTVKFSYGFRGSELTIEKEGVSSILTFDKVPYNVFVTWNSISMICLDMVGAPNDPEEVRVWPSDAPVEYRSYVEKLREGMLK